ncbi:MAG: ABC transporter substrate-binding protein [Comamonadaceae bacterium]|nr:ABC transporter substrate-binding protein [Comamonadaceae bacterium]
MRHRSAIDVAWPGRAASALASAPRRWRRRRAAQSPPPSRARRAGARRCRTTCSTRSADKALQSATSAELNALVDEKILPYVNFEKMTAAGGRAAAGARPRPSSAQALTREFRTLLVRTYAGAVSQVQATTRCRCGRSAPSRGRHRRGGAHQRRGVARRPDPARLPPGEDRRRLEDLRRQRRSACGWSRTTATPFATRDQPRRRRRPDQVAGRPQQGARAQEGLSGADAHRTTDLEAPTDQRRGRRCWRPGARAIRGGDLPFDLAAVRQVDSAAVALLLEWQREAPRAGASRSAACRRRWPA